MGSVVEDMDVDSKKAESSSRETSSLLSTAENQKGEAEDIVSLSTEEKDSTPMNKGENTQSRTIPTSRSVDPRAVRFHEEGLPIEVQVFLSTTKRTENADIILVSEHKKVPTHKALLSGYSNFFKRKFSTDVPPKKIPGIQRLNVDIPPKILTVLVDSLYNKGSTLSFDQAKDLITYTTKHEIEYISNKCIELISDNVCAENCLEMLIVATDSNNKKFIEMTEGSVHKHLKSMLKKKEFLNLPMDRIIQLIDRKNSNMSAEIVNQLVEGWLAHGDRRQDMNIFTQLKVIQLFRNEDKRKTSILDQKPDEFQLETSESYTPGWVFLSSMITPKAAVDAIKAVTTDVVKLVSSGKAKNHLGEDIKVKLLDEPIPVPTSSRLKRRHSIMASTDDDADDDAVFGTKKGVVLPKILKKSRQSSQATTETQTDDNLTPSNPNDVGFNSSQISSQGRMSGGFNQSTSFKNNTNNQNNNSNTDDWNSTSPVNNNDNSWGNRGSSNNRGRGRNSNNFSGVSNSDGNSNRNNDDGWGKPSTNNSTNDSWGDSGNRSGGRGFGNNSGGSNSQSFGSGFNNSNRNSNSEKDEWGSTSSTPKNNSTRNDDWGTTSSTPKNNSTRNDDWGTTSSTPKNNSTRNDDWGTTTSGSSSWGDSSKDNNNNSSASSWGGNDNSRGRGRGGGRGGRGGDRGGRGGTRPPREPRPDDWECKSCGANSNFGSRSECFKCHAPKPADAGNSGRGGGGRGRGFRGRGRGGSSWGGNNNNESSNSSGWGTSSTTAAAADAEDDDWDAPAPGATSNAPVRSNEPKLAVDDWWGPVTPPSVETTPVNQGERDPPSTTTANVPSVQSKPEIHNSSRGGGRGGRGRGENSWSGSNNSSSSWGKNGNSGSYGGSTTAADDDWDAPAPNTTTIPVEIDEWGPVKTAPNVVTAQVEPVVKNSVETPITTNPQSSDSSDIQSNPKTLPEKGTSDTPKNPFFKPNSCGSDPWEAPSVTRKSGEGTEPTEGKEPPNVQKKSEDVAEPPSAPKKLDEGWETPSEPKRSEGTEPPSVTKKLDEGWETPSEPKRSEVTEPPSAPKKLDEGWETPSEPKRSEVTEPPSATKKLYEGWETPSEPKKSDNGWETPSEPKKSVEEAQSSSNKEACKDQDFTSLEPDSNMVQTTEDMPKVASANPPSTSDPAAEDNEWC